MRGNAAKVQGHSRVFGVHRIRQAVLNRRRWPSTISLGFGDSRFPVPAKQWRTPRSILVKARAGRVAGSSCVPESRHHIVIQTAPAGEVKAWANPMRGRLADWP